MHSLKPIAAPRDFTWDCQFADILAQLSEYRVTLGAWDAAGNHREARGMLAIPDPGPSASCDPD